MRPSSSFWGLGRSSLVPQSADRVNPGCPPGGNVAGDICRGHERDADGSERRHIARADSEQEGRQHADSPPLASPEKDQANAWVRLFREVTESKNRPDTHCVTQRCAPSVWGRLATCAAVGYRRRSAASAAVGRAQRAPPIGRSLPSCPTMPDLPLSVGTPFFMKFRGPKAHPNRRPKAIVCPTSYTSTVNVASVRSTGRYSVSRSTGSRPALRIRCSNSARRRPCVVVAPASW
jgi:hypothetical protein